MAEHSWSRCGAVYHCVGSTLSCKMVDKSSKLYEISSWRWLLLWLAPGFNFFFLSMRYLEEVSIPWGVLFNVWIEWMGCKCLQNVLIPDWQTGTVMVVLSFLFWFSQWSCTVKCSTIRLCFFHHQWNRHPALSHEPRKWHQSQECGFTALIGPPVLTPSPSAARSSFFSAPGSIDWNVSSRISYKEMQITALNGGC